MVGEGLSYRFYVSEALRRWSLRRWSFTSVEKHVGGV